MSETTDWLEEADDHAADVRAAWGEPDDHLCTLCHGDGCRDGHVCGECGGSGEDVPQSAGGSDE